MRFRRFIQETVRLWVEHWYIFVITPIILLYAMVGGMLMFSAFALYQHGALNGSEVTLQFGETSCDSGIYIAPQIVSSSNNKFEVSFRKRTGLLGYNIVAQQRCISARTLLSEKSEYPLKLRFFDSEEISHRVIVQTVEYPEIISNNLPTEGEVSTRSLLQVELNKNDPLFTYRLSSSENWTECVLVMNKLSCDLSQLQLKQGNSYTLTLDRYFEERVISQLFKTDISTVTPLFVESHTPTINEKSYNVSTAIDVAFNKPIVSDSLTGGLYQLKDGNRNQIAGSFILSEDRRNLTFKPSSPLPTHSSLEFELSQAVSDDSSYLDAAFKLPFSIAGGPEVIAIGIKNPHPPTQTITVSFDQSLLKGQRASDFITITPSAPFTASLVGSTISIKPTLAYCSTYTLNVKEGVLGSYNLRRELSNSYTVKTQCIRSVLLGYSVSGRPIYAYYIGNGPRKIVYFGSMHGSESNTQTLLNSWKSYVDLNWQKIPTDKTVIIVPSLNPDGVLARSRLNTNGVDLNRNFDTPNWQQQTYFNNGVIFPNGGGTAPFSEPESRILRDLMYREQPFLTLSFHSAASCVIASGSASVGPAQLYAQKAGYTYVPPGTPGPFQYPITGSFDDWATINGFTEIVIELSSSTSSQYDRNLGAMWSMLEL